MPDEQLLKAFGQRIRQLRTAKGISQELLSSSPPARGGVATASVDGVGGDFHRTYIGMIERGPDEFRS